MDKLSAEEFLKNILENNYTEQEHQVFLTWLKTAPEFELEDLLCKHAASFEVLPDDNRLQHTEILKNIELEIDKLAVEKEVVTVKLWPKFKIAAGFGFLLLLLSSLYFIQSSTPPATNVLKSSRITPGTNKAILTLSDGSNILITDSVHGFIAHEGKFRVTKANAGALVYEAIEGSKLRNKRGFNTITTPNGGQFSVVLPDGSKVWLNAASSLKFPTSFDGSERRVELNGEAYFEVYKNKALPFKVHMHNSEIEVLGTHFNASAYHDDAEAGTTTTLLEGSIKIKSGQRSELIHPGQQARVKNGIQISDVDISESIEWKNGNFNFSHESFENIMKKIARWYDVDVEYRGSITHEGFVGTVPRTKDISEVLRRLELTGLVHFKLVGRRVIVMP